MPLHVGQRFGSVPGSARRPLHALQISALWTSNSRSTPKNLSKDQRELLKQLAASMGADVKPQEDRGFMGKIKDALG